MKKQFILAGLLVGLTATAQYEKRVGINTDKPRATLEVRTVPITDENKNKTKAQGILFPYINEAEKSRWEVDNAKGLIAGTVIWNTNKKCLDYFNGTTWQCTNGTKQNTHGMPWVDVETLELTAGTFEGTYKEGVAFTSANTVKFKLKNNGTEPIANLNLTNVVSVANGSATITATGQNANAVSIPVGGEVEITYTLSGTPVAGTLTATFTYQGLTKSVDATVAEDVRTPNYPNTGTLTVSAGKHTIFSMYDNNYFPYSAPATDAVASWETNVAPTGDTTNEPLIDKQGTIPAAGKVVKIPITYTGSNTTLEAFTSNAVAIDPNGEQGVTNSTRKLILSWEEQTLTNTTEFITAKITPADGQDLNVTKLDLQSGLDGNMVGPKLAEFSIPASNTNTSTTVPYTIRVTPGIPDRNFGQADKKHDFVYLPIKAEDGKIWLNNNLGAEYADYNDPNGNFDPSQQATSRSDHKAFGSLFQWQRQADGHELITWKFENNSYQNSTKSNSVQGPINADWVAPANDTNFYYNGSSPYSWVSSTYNSSNHTYWQSGGKNNPCPSGFHVPTATEWSNLHTKSGGSHPNDWWARTSTLRLPSVGWRRSNGGDLYYQSSYGYYWSSEPDGTSGYSYTFYFASGGSHTGDSYSRGLGYSVRCLKD